jgi:hypothetical protein
MWRLQRRQECDILGDRMTTSAILTRERCDFALSMLRGTLEAELRRDGAFRAAEGELVVLDPTRTYGPRYEGGPSNADFLSEVILWTHAFGDREQWAFAYGDFARAKAYLSFKHRLPADVAVQQYPYLLEPGMAKYGGSAVDPGGLVVSFSGALPYHDKQISEMMIAAIRAACTARMQDLLADTSVHML